MAVSQEEQVLAQRVVDETKLTARVDTGMLRRSIYYTVARGMVVFRQLFYGQFGDNSQLIDNARRIMGDTPYRIEELDEEGNLKKEETSYSSGRKYTAGGKSSKRSNAGELALRILKQRKKDGEEKRN